MGGARTIRGGLFLETPRELGMPGDYTDVGFT